MTLTHFLRGSSSKLKLVHGDVLKVPFPPQIDAMVANIPYQISSPLLGRILSHTPLIGRAVLLVQKEFAERMVAK